MFSKVHKKVFSPIDELVTIAVIVVSVGVVQKTISLKTFPIFGLSFTVIVVLVSTELHSVSVTTKFTA